MPYMRTLNQQQTEALINLLLVGRYADKSLSLAETEALDQEIEKLPWSSPTARSLFLQQSVYAVRNALDAAGSRAAFIKAQCAAFDDAESKRSALHALESVLIADGIDAREQELLTEVRGHLGL